MLNVIDNEITEFKSITTKYKISEFVSIIECSYGEEKHITSSSYRANAYYIPNFEEKLYTYMQSHWRTFKVISFLKENKARFPIDYLQEVTSNEIVLLDYGVSDLLLDINRDIIPTPFRISVHSEHVDLESAYYILKKHPWVKYLSQVGKHNDYLDVVVLPPKKEINKREHKTYDNLMDIKSYYSGLGNPLDNVLGLLPYKK